MGIEYEQDTLSENHKELIKILHYFKKIRNLNREKKKTKNTTEMSQVKSTNGFIPTTSSSVNV